MTITRNTVSAAEIIPGIGFSASVLRRRNGILRTAVKEGAGLLLWQKRMGQLPAMKVIAGGGCVRRAVMRAMHRA